MVFVETGEPVEIRTDLLPGGTFTGSSTKPARPAGDNASEAAPKGRRHHIGDPDTAGGRDPELSGEAGDGGRGTAPRAGWPEAARRRRHEFAASVRAEFAAPAGFSIPPKAGPRVRATMPLVKTAPGPEPA